MDNVKRRALAGVEEEEDRLSSLPDELIHKILSYFDIKFCVQTCVVSRRWEFVWTTMPCLNFSTEHFRVLRKFSKFVNHVVSKHNHQIKVSYVNLHFRGNAVKQDFVKKIAKYAFSHNVEQLTVLPPLVGDYICPPCLCSSKSLKHFTLFCHTIKTPLDFPALTTLNLDCVRFMWDGNDSDLFSKCVNLKNLTLHHFIINKVFDIITPRLCNLVLNYVNCLKTINVIAPQLENLTINDCSIHYLNVSQQLSSLCYTSWVGCCVPLQFGYVYFLNMYLKFEEEDDGHTKLK